MKRTDILPVAIPPVKYRIGNCVFNANEIRAIMLRVAKGELAPRAFDIVELGVDDPNWVQITSHGGLTDTFKGNGFNVQTQIQFAIMKVNKQKK